MAQLAFGAVVLILLLFVSSSISSSAAAQYNNFNKYARNRNAQQNAAKWYHSVNQNEQTTREFTLNDEETPVHGLDSETPPSESPPAPTRRLPNNHNYNSYVTNTQDQTNTNQNMNNALGEEEAEKFKAYAKNKYDEGMYEKYNSEFDEVNNPLPPPPPHTRPHSSIPYKQSQNNLPPPYTVRAMGNPFTGRPQNDNVGQNEEAYYSTKTNNKEEEHQSQHYDLNDEDTNPNIPPPPYRGFVRSAFTGTLEFDMANPEEADKESNPTSFDEEMFDPDNAGQP